MKRRAIKRKRELLEGLADAMLPMELLERRSVLRSRLKRCLALLEALAMAEDELLKRWRLFVLTRPTVTRPGDQEGGQA